MLVYHGTVLQIAQPDIKHSKKHLDFGPGFYVTTFPQQAEKWALRKAMRKDTTGIVNVYEMLTDLTDFRVLKFKNADAEWLDFVCACRRGEDVYKDYDIVIGNVADDDVFKSVDMYFRGLWDKQRTLDEIRYYKRNDQIVFITKKAVAGALTFVKAYKVVK